MALLFLLQPIVRGWARYNWRLTVRSQPPVFNRAVAREQLEELETSEQVGYWSEGGEDRYAFLTRILSKLEAEGWQHKTDTGWSDHDVEIFGSRWSRMRLATVTEELGQGKRIFRSRLKANWSLPARIVFWSACGAELSVIGWLSSAHPWIWMLPLSICALGWWLEQERRNLLLWIAALLDEVAAEQKMVKIQREPESLEPTVVGTR